MLENKSLFSNETLDSIAMAETYGGEAQDVNVFCGKRNCENAKCDASCGAKCECDVSAIDFSKEAIASTSVASLSSLEPQTVFSVGLTAK